MKITYASNSPIKRAIDLDVGDVFSGRIGAIDSIFLRVFDEVIDLMNERNTWDLMAIPALTIKGYKGLDVDLIVRGEK